jgi:hypothetical protein
MYPLADLGVQLAWEMYEISITQEDALGILMTAIDLLCRNDYNGNDDYLDVIEKTIAGISERIEPYK